MKTSRKAVEAARHHFAGALQSALTLKEVEAAFLSAVDQVISADALGMYRFDGGSGAVIGVRARAGTDFLDDYEDYGRADDPVLDFLVAHRRPIDSSRFVAADRWISSGAASALEAAGYRHSMEAPIIVSGSLFGTVNFARTADLPPFSGVDLVSARLTAEQLGLAAERALRFEGTGRRTTMLERVLDRIPQALVVTDLDAQVLFRNRAAGNDPDLMSHGAPDQRPGVVSETIAEAMEEFRVRGKRVHTRSVRAQGSGRRVVVKSYRLSDQHNAAVTLLFDCTDERSGRLPLWDVLSPREQDIAELVSKGLTTKEIAERAFVSENTVKQHLKRVFAKTDVRNRAELVQLIWTAGSGKPSSGTDGY